MNLIGTHSEREQIGKHTFRHIQHLRPIAYNDGILKRIASNFADSGISYRPYLVSESPLMVSVADDGMRRLHPTRELDRYVEVGAPYVKVGGVWRQVGFAGANLDAGIRGIYRTTAGGLETRARPRLLGRRGARLVLRLGAALRAPAQRGPSRLRRA